MWTRLGLSALLILGGWAFASPPVHASCEVQTGTSTYNNGQFIGGDLCDVNGNKKVTTTGSSGVAGGTANASAPSLVEATTYGFFLDLSGNMRVTIPLLSGEDQAAQLLATSGGSVRITQILGTGGIPSTATDATSATSILPVGMKTFQGIVTCTGTCVQTQKIYGTWLNSAVVASSALVCTLTISASTTASDWCATDRNFSYWFVVTTLTSGTTPLSGIFVQY